MTADRSYCRIDDPLSQRDGARIYVGNCVSRMLRRSKTGRTIRVVAAACVHWAAALMKEAGMDEARFALWCTRIFRAAKAGKEKDG